MARDFPSDLTAVGESLEEFAGEYLRSVHRQLQNVCVVCALPVTPASTHCFQCKRHASSGRALADRVGSLIYAVEGRAAQSYMTVRNYKAPLTGPSLVQRMRELLAVGLRGHVECAGVLAGDPVTGWAVVASRTGRPALRGLVLEIAKDPSQEVQIAVRDDAPHRILAPDSWSVTARSESLSHAIVIDDSWVSGASAQSVAGSLKADGVAHVSILTVARILNPTDRVPEVVEFVDHILPTLEFDWRRCPWTADGVCPVP